MTVDEMHIGIDQGLQKINSEVFDTFLPEEKDWHLNLEVLEFIKNRTSPKSNLRREGFQSTKKRYDDLEELITSASIGIYKDTDIEQFGLLPPNYFRMVDIKPNVQFSCAPIAVTETNTDVYSVVLPFIDDDFTEFIISAAHTTLGSVTLFDLSDYPNFQSTLTDERQKYEIIHFVLYEVNRLFDDIEIRWENYNGTYHRNSFILVTENPDYTIGLISITGFLPIIEPFVPETFITLNSIEGNKKDVSTRLVKIEDYLDLVNHPFGTTHPNSPLSTISTGRIVLRHNETFIFNTLNIEYIRRPRQINLSLNQSCELNPNVHEEIVDKTVERLAALIESSNYENVVRENISIE